MDTNGWGGDIERFGDSGAENLEFLPTRLTVVFSSGKIGGLAEEGSKGGCVDIGNDAWSSNADSISSSSAGKNFFNAELVWLIGLNPACFTGAKRGGVGTSDLSSKPSGSGREASREVGGEREDCETGMVSGGGMKSNRVLFPGGATCRLSGSLGGARE